MTGLGLVVTWAGYLVLTYGYWLVKSKTVTIGDLALPSRRARTLALLAEEGALPSSPTAQQLQQQGLGIAARPITSGPQAGMIAGGSQPTSVSGLGPFFNPVAGR